MTYYKNILILCLTLILTACNENEYIIDGMSEIEVCAAAHKYVNRKVVTAPPKKTDFECDIKPYGEYATVYSRYIDFYGKEHSYRVDIVSIDKGARSRGQKYKQITPE